MRDFVHSGDEAAVAAASVGIGPRTLTLLCGCALSTTAFIQGAVWLGETTLGLPAGVWVVAAATGLVHVLGVVGVRRPRRGQAVPGRASAGETIGAGVRRLRASGDAAVRKMRSVPAEAVGATLLELAGVPARHVNGARRHLSRLGNPRSRREGRLRIGVDLSDADFAGLMSCVPVGTGGGDPVEWVRAKAGLFADAHKDADKFDALIRRTSASAGGDPVIVMPGRSRRCAVWTDWNERPVLGYATVFPAAINASRVTLAGCEFGREMDARLAAEMAVAAAALGRSADKPEGARTQADADQAFDAMRRLGETVRRARDAAREGEVSIEMARAAARAVGAWFTTRDDALEVIAARDVRRQSVEAAAELLADEPEGLLRLACAQVAALREEDVVGTLRGAYHKLRETRAECRTDPLAFVMSEIEMGAAGVLTLGRVAAGLCLLWATASATSRAHLRDDLMDDLRHAGWMMGRDRDVLLLRSVMDELEKLDRAGVRPASAAA